MTATGRHHSQFALTTAALIVTLASGFAYFAPIVAETPIQVAALEGANSQSNRQGIAHMSASRKSRCIMPPALRTSCDL